MKAIEVIEPLIEQRHIDAAMAAGACGIDGIQVGAGASTLSLEQAVWFEGACSELAREVLERGGISLWAWSGYGYGYGDGDGDGYGYGYGSGYGYGYGSGEGYGYGEGYGDGRAASQ